MTKQEIGAILMNLREKSGKSREEVAELLGKSVKTIGHWETGYAQPDANTLFLLCVIYDADLNASFGFSSSKSKNQKASSLSDEAKKVATRYTKLDRFGKAAVQAVMGEEEARIKEQEEMELPLTKPEPKIIPLYLVPAAAGYTSPIFGSDYEMYELTPEDPQGAMFAIKVAGDSMEPAFPDGSIVFCNKDPIADGEIGVFCLDGESFIKQYHHDKFMGMTYLFSLNRARKDADKFLYPSGGQTLTCMGRVITQRRYPLPRL